MTSSSGLDSSRHEHWELGDVMGDDLVRREPRPAGERYAGDSVPAGPRKRGTAVRAATAAGLAMVGVGVAAVCWVELYVQSRDPGWNAIPWTPLAWCLVGAGIVTVGVTEAYIRWPRLTASGFVRPRTHNQNQTGKLVWAVAAALGTFEVINRTWLGHYPSSSTHPPSSWTEWHRDPAAVGMFVLVYFGVWWEAGRLGRSGIRRTLRALLFPILPLLACLVILFALAMAAGAGGGFSPNL